MRRIAFLLVLALAAGGRAQAPTAEELAAFERSLRDHHLPTSGPELLKFFRERTLSRDQVAQLAAKVELLGSQNYGQRVKAAADLVKAGHLAKPVLQELVKNPLAGAEAVRRAELCLRQITEGNEAALAVATAHLIARDKPDGAAQVLIRFTPFATDAVILEAVQAALNVLALRDGAAEPALVSVLREKSYRQRAAAGEALVRGTGTKSKQLVGHLLQDPIPQVRLQVALALAEAKDKGAIPVLIQALAELPVEQTWLAEDFLVRLAGESGPSVSLGSKTPAAEVRAAWEKWWYKHEPGLDLERLGSGAPFHGYTLVSLMVPGAGLNGQILELRPNREIHWKIDGLRYPLDAQVIGRDRVLITEYLNNRITERDFKGNVLWEKTCPTPLSCQRFATGETFIVSRRNLVLVDRNGKEVFTYFPPISTIVAAQRARNGHMTLVTSNGRLQVLDAQGKEIRGFPVGMMNYLGTSFELLPGGRVLVPLFRENRVVEYDAVGQVAWQAAVLSPITVTRLPNGNTLAASSAQQRLVEVNRAGVEVASIPLAGRPWCVRRR